VIELDETNDGDAIQMELYRMTGQRTVPNVWVKGQFIGGNSETQRAAATGRLHELLS
jgi:glutaredoxin 3